MANRFVFPIGANAESVREQIGAIGPATAEAAFPSGVRCFVVQRTERVES